MIQYHKKTLFITLEGGEGAGKTTQINRLGNLLTEEGYKVITTREPGGTAEGERIRGLLVRQGKEMWSAMSEVLLLLAARSLHVERVVKPALELEKIVICDRFSDSTLAYQGYGRGLPIEKIKTLSQEVLGDIQPDLTFILDIDPEVGLRRSTKRLASEGHGGETTEDRFEKLDLSFHQRVRDGFLDIAKSDSKRCHVIDASQSTEDIAAQIKEVIFKHL